MHYFGALVVYITLLHTYVIDLFIMHIDVRLLRSMERNFQIFTELPFPPHVAEVVGKINCLWFLYHSGILNTTSSFLYLNHAIFYMASFCVYRFRLLFHV